MPTPLPWPPPPFTVVARRRPVALVQPGTDLAAAPYAAVEADLVARPGGPAPAAVGLESGEVRLLARHDGGRVALEAGGRRLTSRRHRRARDPDALALTLTGPVATAWTREAGSWVARARVDLTDPDGPVTAPVHDEAWLRDLRPVGDPARTGRFGQLGLRDLRVVSHADGAAYDSGDGRVLLTATSAGAGGFGTGHASVWALDPADLTLEHRADLFFRRPGAHDVRGTTGGSGGSGVYGDHACHLVRDGDRWLVAASTWGDFDRVRHPVCDVVLAEVDAATLDPTRGVHVLDTRPLPLPTAGLVSVGRWDPQLVQTRDGWRVAFVSATRWFRFHPVVAEGPTLDALTLRAAATDRTACEGPVLLPTTAGLRLLASDGRDGRRRHRPGYPVLDLDLREVGRLTAAYPSNLPWPSLVRARQDGSWLMVGFDGTPAGGPLPGYGTHGDVVVQRSLVGP